MGSTLRSNQPIRQPANLILSRARILAEIQLLVAQIAELRRRVEALNEMVKMHGALLNGIVGGNQDGGDVVIDGN